MTWSAVDHRTWTTESFGTESFSRDDRFLAWTEWPTARVVVTELSTMREVLSLDGTALVALCWGHETLSVFRKEGAAVRMRTYAVPSGTEVATIQLPIGVDWVLPAAHASAALVMWNPLGRGEPRWGAIVLRGPRLDEAEQIDTRAVESVCGGRIASIALAGNGEQVAAITADTQKESRLAIIDRGGTVRSVTSVGFDMPSARLLWSNGNGLLLVWRRFNGPACGGAIWRLDRPTIRELAWLGEDSAHAAAHVSPDGKRIATVVVRSSAERVIGLVVELDGQAAPGEQDAASQREVELGPLHPTLGLPQASLCFDANGQILSVALTAQHLELTRRSSLLAQPVVLGRVDVLPSAVGGVLLVPSTTRRYALARWSVPSSTRQRLPDRSALFALAK